MSELYKMFKEIDPFNPSNTLEGKIFLDEDRYGSMIVYSVNEKQCIQYIHTTPKFKYPGGSSNRSIEFDEFDYDELFIFEKLDGTNICMFRYEDAEGHLFTSFKTRKMPFLWDSPSEKWLSLWKRLLERYEGMFEMLNNLFPEKNFGFELYGSINQLLINYNCELDTKLLYSIERKTGQIGLPINYPFTHPQWIHLNQCNKNELIEYYKNDEEQLNEEFQTSHSIEGHMYYFLKNLRVIDVWKCKPKAVLSTPCDEGSGLQLIGENDILTTCKNAIESSNLDQLFEETKTLLLETYSSLQVELSLERIRSIVETVVFQERLKVKLFEEYDKITSTGLNWKLNRKDILIQLAKIFSKDEMKSIFKILDTLYGK